MRVARALARMRALPLAPLDVVAPGTSLILAPHPDDESLGCGGLIAACCDAGRPPLVVAVTDGGASHPGSLRFPPSRLAAVRAAEMVAAAAILGVPSGRVHALGLPDAGAPQAGACFDRAAREVAGLVRAHGVRTVFASWPHDPHRDHHATAVLARSVCAAAGVAGMHYPVWGWLLPGEAELPLASLAGWRLDVTAHRARKRRAIAAHASQYGDLIADAPEGFRLPRDLLEACDGDSEVFLAA